MSKLITIAIDAKSGPPIQVPRSRIGHLHVIGMTGSSASSFALLNLISQFMPPHKTHSRSSVDPIVIIDLGGDHSLFRMLASSRRKKDECPQHLDVDPTAAARAEALRLRPSK